MQASPRVLSKTEQALLRTLVAHPRRNSERRDRCVVRARRAIAAFVAVILDCPVEGEGTSCFRFTSRATSRDGYFRRPRRHPCRRRSQRYRRTRRQAVVTTKLVSIRRSRRSSQTGARHGRRQKQGEGPSEQHRQRSRQRRPTEARWSVEPKNMTVTIDPIARIEFTSGT